MFIFVYEIESNTGQRQLTECIFLRYYLQKREKFQS